MCGGDGAVALWDRFQRYKESVLIVFCFKGDGL